MPKWTEEQLEAIESRNRNILVSAAAGSGKTAVLIERIASLIIRDKVEVDQLLVVTFTNAAAGEMRERLIKRLRQEYLINDSKYIRNQIGKVQKASISTIHAYCIELIRRNFHILDIDPNFKIADESNMSLLREEILEELMEESYEMGEENFYKLIEMYTNNKNDDGLRTLILELYYFSQSKPNPIEWLRKSVDSYKCDIREFKDSENLKYLLEDIKIDLNGLTAIAKFALDYCVENDLVEYLPFAEEEYNSLLNLCEVEWVEVEELIGAMQQIQFKRLASVRGERKKIIEEYAEVYKDKRKKIKLDIDKISKKYGVVNLELEIYKMNQLYEPLKYLIDLVQKFSSRFKEEKNEKIVLDFNDIEHYAIEVLENDEISKKEMKRYRYIFLDEYQDTNEIQETIISKIKQSKNLFQVGDVKQSIYRFRLADPTIFINKRKHYEKTQDSNQVIHLFKNFRSRSNLLDGINELFKGIMSEKLGEVEYSEKEYLNAGIVFESEGNKNLSVELICKDKDLVEKENIDETLKNFSKIEKEALYIASRIKDLIQEKTYDAKLGELRDVKYRDIVILLRAVRSSAMIFSDIFLEEGIPLYVDDTEGYLDSLEVSLLVNLLKIIDNRNYDIPLISVLRSPVFKFETDELIKIRIEDREVSYYEATLRYVENNEDELSDRLKNFYSKIDKWEKRSKLVKLSDLFWEILIETNFYYFVAALPGGKQRQANIRLLIDRANEFEKSSFGGLFDFIRYTKKLKNQNQDFSAAKIIGENEDVVRIMSIHKSKGLEFPIVICACMAKKFNQQDLRKKLIMHKDFGLATQYVDTENRQYEGTLLLEIMKQAIKIENLSEEMRILYVAMTRAVDKLILTGYVSDIDKKVKAWNDYPELYVLRQDSSYLDWLMRVLLQTNASQNLIESNVSTAIFRKNKTNYNINVIYESELVRNYKNKVESLEIFRSGLEKKVLDNEQLKKTIENSLNWKYDHRKLCHLKRKYSVSEINMSSNSEILDKDRVKKITTEKSLDFKNRGILLHLILEKIIDENLNNLKELEDVKKFMNSFNQSDNLLLKTDYENIYNYTQSKLFKRLKQSSRVFKEQPFVLKESSVILGSELEGETILIQGIIDLFFETEQGVVLVDYKSGGGSYMSDEYIKNKYYKQIQLYKKAIEKILNCKVVEAYLYMIETGKLVQI